MVKINGQRVETQEVESVIRTAEGVSEAAVKDFEDESGQTYIVGYYCAGDKTDEADIVNAMKKSLPTYMIPRFLRRLDRMPVNYSGKLDRNALLPPTGDEYKEEYTAPENELQQKLCEGMERILSCGKIGIKDDFFRMGGDSIKVVALCESCGLAGLTPAMLLEGKTPEGIALLYSEAEEKAQDKKEQKAEKRDRYPLNGSQLGVWLDCVNDRNSLKYNLPFVIRLPEGTDRERFIEAVKKAADSHESFRAFFGTDGSIPYMSISDGEIEVEETEASDIKSVTDSFIRPFDLEAFPLFRFIYVHTDEGDFFLMDVHHLIFDGTSLGVFLTDIADLYDVKEIKQEERTLTAESLSEEGVEKTDEYKASLSYFRDRISDWEDSLPLPESCTDAKSSFGELSIASPDSLSAGRTEDFIRRAGITENTLFLSAFAYTLAKYNAQQNASFVSYNNGRHDTALIHSTGMFVRTFPLCVEIDENREVMSFLRDTQDYFYESMSHDIVRLGDVSAFAPVKPDVSFLYQGLLFKSVDMGNGSLLVKPLSIGDLQSPFEVTITKEDEGYTIHIRYDRGRYSEGFITSFTSSMLCVAEGMMSAAYLKDIIMLSPRQEKKLASFNETEKDYDNGKTVTALFEEAAAEHPDNTAIIFKDKRISYRELEERSRNIAAYIHGLGLSRGDVVSILIPRGEYQAIASFGALRAGCAYQPLDQTYPEERLNFMVNDSGAKLLITTEELSEKITDFSGKRLMLSETENLPTGDLSGVEKNIPDDLFILLYTSGSTGVPKGVRILHRNLVCFISWYRQLYGMTDKDVIGQYASYGFDACMMDMYPALSSGAAVCFIPEDMRLDLTGMDRYMTERGVTILFMTTQVARQYALEAKNPNLRILSTGGEKLVVMDAPDGIDFYNLYGPTECTIISTYYKVGNGENYIPIGRPLDNMKCYVVDIHGHLLPPGAAGELWIAGPQVAGGYLNRPDITEKAFIDNPFDKGKYSALYKSGDIVRFASDGNLEFIGRRDGQVKIRGFRIELSEIESVIREYPGIKDATVADFDHPVDGKFVAAYVVSNETVDIEAMKTFIRDRKPPYMVPAAIMQLDSIPLNQNSKVNKRALPKPEIKQEDLKLPENEKQQLIYDIVSDCIGSKSFGVDTDLYMAGLTSLDEMRLMAMLSDKTGTKLRLTDIKDNPTVERLADFLKTDSAGEDKYEILPDYPVTDTQYGIFIESMDKTGTTVYNIPMLYRFGRGVDAERLKAAVAAVIDAHPFMKTCFFMNDEGEARTMRRDDAEAVVELKNGAPGDIDALVKPFDVSGGKRLYRAEIYNADDAVYLFLDTHHIISDGYSIGVLFADIASAYAGEAIEKEKFTGYEQALFEKELKEGESYGKAERYYKDLFEGCETDVLPVSDVREERERKAHTVTYTSRITVNKAEEYCGSIDVTPAAFFDAVFGFALAAYNYTDESVFTTVYNGRNDSRLNRTVSMLVKTLPMLCRVPGDREIGEYVSGIKRQLMDSMDNDIYSFAEISNSLGIRADILFVYQGDYERGFELAGEKGTSIPLALNEVKAGLTINIFRDGDHYRMTCEYSEDMYTEGFVERLLGTVDQCALEFMVRERLKDVLPAASDAVSDVITFNDTERDYDKGKTVSALFEEAAENYPDNIALIFEDKKITYRELERRSRAIAAYIHGLGLGRGDVVSILIPRGEYQAIASFGALRAGCAYQPLDQTYPEDRLNFMVKDAGARLLITTEDLSGKISDYDGETLMLSKADTLPDGDISDVERPVPDDLFILLYTSGSTGVPKGVRLLHRNLVCFINWYRRYYSLTDKDVVGQYASYGFDACMMDMYPALVSGAAVCFIPEDIRLDLNRMDQYMASKGVTLLFMTTQVCRQYAMEAKNPHLRALSAGGEKLVPIDAPDGFELHNGYGPTECTIFSTTYKVGKGEKYIPIGRPLDNMKCYVVDMYGHLLPRGAAGELWLAGPQIGGGYLNRPDITGKAFIDNPFDGGEYASLYRTGDVVRLSTDSNIEFIGRRDGQVKVRGFRIELTEVEAVIREYPGIKDAVVTAFDHPSDGKFVAAYVVSDEEVDAKALADFIREKKPPYMVPESIMQIDRIPLNQNSKVNKRALPVPELKSGAKNEAQERKANVLEEQLKAMTEEAIGAGEADFGTELSYLGLTSITAIRLSTLLFKRFGADIPSRELLKSNLIDIENIILNNLLSGARPGEAMKEEAADAGSRDMKEFPLTAAQLGIYLECLKNPGSTMYNIPFILEFTPDTDVDELKRVVKKIFKLHPSVFVHFEMKEDSIKAVRDEESEVPIPVLEMSDEETEKYEKGFVRPFRQDEGSLFRLSIVKTKGRVLLYVDIHHLIFDGMSLSIFLKDLSELLGGHEAEAEEYSYGQFALLQDKAKTEGIFDEHRAYIDGLFEEYEAATELSPDKGTNEAKGENCFATAKLSQDTLDAACRRVGVTEAGMILSALYLCLSRYTASERVYLATISSGRRDVRYSGTFGMFVNTIPLSGKLADMSVDEYIKSASDGFAQAIEHEEYPFAEVSAAFGFKPSIVYEYQRGVVGEAKIPGLIRMREAEAGPLKFPMIVRVMDDENGPLVSVEYNSGMYSKELIESFVRSLVIVTGQFAGDGKAMVRGISLLDDEREKQIKSFRTSSCGKDTVPDTNDNVLFQSGLERYAIETPEALALVACDRSYTYDEFDREANRIANALLDMGITPGSRIAILLPRTSRVMLSIFGVLKAGCAYIPCDPEYPEDRIKLILSDSKAAKVITTADRLSKFEEGRALDVEELILKGDDNRPDIEISPESLCYLIYTSGSTGRPKGVQLKHSGAANYMTDAPGNIMVDAIARDGHVFVCITTLSFDMSIKEFGISLYNGKTVVLASETETNDPAALAKLMKSNRVDMFNATPSRLLSLMESEEFRNALSECRIIICGAEKYADGLLPRLKELTEARIFNSYGPTEITVSSNAKELTKADVITVGRPLYNVSEFIVDSDGNELPAGVTGELYIGGKGVALGYNDLPEETSARFIEYKGERVYRSGDYARWNGDGDVVILGRTDNQVKLRGLRIESGEVENAISEYPHITRAAVKIDTISGIEHLCAWFTADEKIDIGELKAEIGKTLTNYMVPTAYMQLDRMPVTANGKLDLKALPPAQVYRAVSKAAISSTAEKDFCDIFSKLLHIDDVMPDEDFFALGGTSLLVTNVIIAAQRAGYSIAYGDVFSNPTPRKLAIFAARVADEASGVYDKEIEEYDYDSLRKVLSSNNLENFKKGSMNPLGNVLITGGAGYLGSHILHELLENETGKIYVLLRSSGERSAGSRLFNKLYYYFEKDYEPLTGERLFIVDGDVTGDSWFDEFKDGDIDTVINCAAVVKHFSKGTEIEEVNVGGVKRLIDFCLDKNARLIQVSTMSTVDSILKSRYKDRLEPDERSLYFGQSLSNKYIRSKFLGEREVLEAIAAKGLKAKIMRVGNLAARYSDGEFQINFRTNSAMGRLKAFAMLGCCPYSILDKTMEFSPIDEVAKAIVLLSGTPDEAVIFHPYNQQKLLMGAVFEEMGKLGLKVMPVETDEFNLRVKEAESDPVKAEILTSMLAYMGTDKSEEVVPLDRHNEYTMQVLYRLGYRWPVTTWDYVDRFVTGMKGMGFFDI